MKSHEIRSRFIEFFKNRPGAEHAVLPSASLVTSDEKGITNSTLFNTAGMQPLVPFLLGETHPEGTRLASVQKCVRTVDIDDIGDNTHATFFEMLGNWSLGDYWKKESIEWSYEFLTNKEHGLGLDPRRLYVTVFEGDENAPRDEVAYDIWKDIFAREGVVGERIYFMGAKSNWWSAGDNGPCGPDTEMFYDLVGNIEEMSEGMSKDAYIEADAEQRVVEVWNNVFMEYLKRDGAIVGKLPQRNVDTGAGLERLTMTMQGKRSIFETDLFTDLMKLAAELTSDEKSQRIIADHMRTATFMIADGVVPSNTDRGYILRRLLRRAIFHTTAKHLSSEHVSELVESIARTYHDSYPELTAKQGIIKQVIDDEAAKFKKTLADGLKQFEKISTGGGISSKDAFVLFSTYGFPIEMTVELARVHNIAIDRAGFDAEFAEHQTLSRAGSEQKFKGGLADSNDPKVLQYHTATHLLHQALHDVLGDHVEQKGSNITPERLRFDFAHPTKMTDEEKKRVEDIVNEKIAAALPMQHVTLSKAEAEKTGARHLFNEKYGDEVSIYFIGNTLDAAYSKEFCGGPHVKNTSELGRFKIQKEEAVSAGVRRIKAILE